MLYMNGMIWLDDAYLYIQGCSYNWTTLVYLHKWLHDDILALHYGQQHHIRQYQHCNFVQSNQLSIYKSSHHMDQFDIYLHDRVSKSCTDPHTGRSGLNK